MTTNIQSLPEVVGVGGSGSREDIPKSMLCPIGQSLLKDPVVAIDGHTYERTNIETWFQIKPTSPMTGESVSDIRLFPNMGLRLHIQEILRLNSHLEKKDEQVLETTIESITRIKPTHATSPRSFHTIPTSPISIIQQMTARIILAMNSSRTIPDVF